MQRLLRQVESDGREAPSSTNGSAYARVKQRGEGQPLSDPERLTFEPLFGADFGRVRLHADAGAGTLSRALGAEAFTLGSDIYFAPGAYRPATAEGRGLLAHELTHVVQQAGAPPSALRVGDSQDPSERQAERVAESIAPALAGGLAPDRAARGPISFERPALAGAVPGIQRRLLVTGKPPDIKAVLDLLEPASGFTLTHEPKTHLVSITHSLGRPPSFVLAGQLATIIDDATQDAELHVGRHQQGVGVGAFPFSGPLIQEIDVDEVARIEAGAPGNGVALLAHEIVENYHAHSPALQDFNRQVVFAESHEEALEAERLVGGELVGPGERVASAVTVIGSGVIRDIDDYDQYFLVVDRKNDRVTSARRVPRGNVSKRVISGFGPGSVVVPHAAQATIAAVAADLQANPTATVRIECGDPDPTAASARAESVKEAILAAGQGRPGFDLRSWRNFRLVGFGLIDLGEATTRAVRAVITVDRPNL